jgi:hypothetical protein
LDDPEARITLACHLKIDRDGALEPGTQCSGVEHNRPQDTVTSGSGFLLAPNCLLQPALFILESPSSDPGDPDSFFNCSLNGAVNRSLDVVAGQMTCDTFGIFASLDYQLLKRR